MRENNHISSLDLIHTVIKCRNSTVSFSTEDENGKFLSFSSLYLYAAVRVTFDVVEWNGHA